MQTTFANDWTIWQLADSAFPTGGFAHSGGLEAVWQHRAISSNEDLEDFLQTALRQVGRGTLPFVNAAYKGDCDKFPEIDHLCDAFTSNHVANRASRLQGQAFLAAAERSFGSSKVTSLRALAREHDLPSHFASAFGAVGSALNIEWGSLSRVFLFTHLRAWIGSGVRLGIVGPLEAQRIQRSLARIAEDIVMECASLGIESIAQTAPILDLFQATQDRLYSRLFQS